FHRADQGAVRGGQAEGLRELLTDVLHRHADTAAAHLAAAHQLILDVQRDINGYRERHPHVAAAAAVDLRIDADHLTLEIEQRAARVAGIHGRIGLNEGHERAAAVVRQRPSDRTDHARGHAILETERRTDRDRPLPGPDACRVAEAHDGQAGCGYLDQCHVAALVDADDFGPK